MKFLDARNSLVSAVQNLGTKFAVQKIVDSLAYCQDNFAYNKVKNLPNDVERHEEEVLYKAAKEFVAAYEEAQQ